MQLQKAIYGKYQPLVRSVFLMNLTLRNNLTLTSVFAITIVGVISCAKPASSQMTPQPWGSVGVEDNEISYSIGARWFDFGVELGGRETGATGVDVLKFVSLPVLSPYIGVGFHRECDENALIIPLG